MNTAERNSRQSTVIQYSLTKCFYHWKYNTHWSKQWPWHSRRNNQLADNTIHTNRFKNRCMCSLVNTSMHVILYMYFMHFFRHIQYLYLCPAQYFSEKSFLSITWLWQQLHLKVMFLLFQDTENGFFMNVNDQVLCNFYSSFLVPAHSVATFIEWCINCQNFLNKLFIQCFTQKLVLLSFYLKWLFASFCIYGAIRICILLKYCSRIDCFLS